MNQQIKTLLNRTKLVDEIYNKKESALFELTFYENCKYYLEQKGCQHPYQWRLIIYNN